MTEWDSVTGDAEPGDGEEYLTGCPGESGEPPGGDLAGHLWMFDGGSLWDLGPAADDADADGIPESLTRTAADSVTVYSDRDLDGRVDRITELDASGECRVSDLDPQTGLWSPTGLGRLD